MDIGLCTAQHRFIGCERHHRRTTDSYAGYRVGYLPLVGPFGHVDLVDIVVLPNERRMLVDLFDAVVLPPVPRTAHRPLRAVGLPLGDAVVVSEARAGVAPGVKKRSVTGHHGNHQQVERVSDADVVEGTDRAVPGQLLDCRPVAHDGRRGTAEDLGGVFDHLFPLQIIEVEARGKGIGGAAVEVVLRNRIVDIADQRKRLLDIPVDFLIYLLEIVPVINRIERRFGSFHVRDSQVFATFFRMIRETIEHREAKMRIGPAKQGFGFGRKQFFGRTLFFDRFQSGVGCGNRGVVGLPGIFVAIVLGLVHVHPVAVVLQQQAGVRIVRSHVVAVVRCDFAHAGETA